MKYRPYDYQKTAMQWILDHPRCGLFLDMGLGKTVSTLTAVQQLMDDCEVSRTLVVAPKKVAETTWTTEAEKWDHLQSLKVAKVMGTEKQRNLALASKADIYVIGRDSFVWLVGIFWQLLAYCAGVGGSMLIIGSAAGVVVMGLEKITFGWYMKHISWIAFVGYIAGIICYWFIRTFLYAI